MWILVAVHHCHILQHRNCGYLLLSTTVTLVSFTFKYWSTECNVPIKTKSFLTSTTTSFPTSILNLWQSQSVLSHSRSWHFSKLSSAFRHFEHSLHVVHLAFFTAWFWFWMRWEFEGQNENQKWFSYSQKHFLGVSQSDFVFRKLFFWTKTQKRDLKLRFIHLFEAVFSHGKI